MDHRNIAVVGCGNIGYRHLQSVAALPGVQRLGVVEKNESRAREVASAALRPSTAASLEFFTDIASLAAAGSWDVVINAVTADEQVKVAQTVLDQIRPSLLLLEKPVAQSVADLDRLVQLAKGAGARVHVNCVRSAWEGYRSLRETIQNRKSPVRVDIVGTDWGYGCNAVHFVDLFRFLTGARTLSVLSSQISVEPIPNKRGEKYEDFSGTVTYKNERDDVLVLVCAVGLRPTAALRASEVTVSVRSQPSDQPIAVCAEPGPIFGEAGTVVPLGSLFLSQSTGKFLKDLVDSTPPGLPTLDEAAISHRAVFDALRLALGRETFRIT